jgi:pyrroloquinoline quinone biosynthesis protein B
MAVLPTSDASEPAFGGCLPIPADRMVVSLGLVDSLAGRRYLFEATPDMPRQLRKPRKTLPSASSDLPDAIFLTHAHLGHCTGLMYLGREALGAEAVPTYAMPRVQQFLQENGLWRQLVEQGNIKLEGLSHAEPVLLGKHLTVTPLRVPHRDELSHRRTKTQRAVYP